VRHWVGLPQAKLPQVLLVTVGQTPETPSHWMAGFSALFAQDSA
jgi:hypothetical protein